MSEEYKDLSLERKGLQEEGLLPDWYTTGGYQLLKKKYLLEGESPKDRYMAVAKTAAQYTEDPDSWTERFFNVMWKGWLSPATPVLSNMGTDRGCSVSCSGTYIGDSVEQFYEKLKENALLSKHGFGTSAYLGDIRPRGSEFGVDGKASGVLPVIKDYITMAQKVSQGSSRRGSIGLYVDVGHKDFYEVADHLFHYPEDNNIGWVYKEEDFNKMESGDKEAIKRYQRTMKIRSVLGRGYLMKHWTAQEQRPQMYKDKGLDVKASNLCVTPDTPILTSIGYIPIGELEGQSVDIWNGEEWSKVDIIKTGTDQKVVKVITSSGQEIECTQYHKFYIQNEYGKKPVIKRTHELQEGDKLLKFELPLIEGKKSLSKAYQNGFYSGDGCNVKGKSRIYLYADKIGLEHKFDLQQRYYQEDSNRVYGYEEGLKDKFFVPTCEYDVISRLDWLAGLSDADGTISRNGSNESLQICSIHKEFLKEVQLMLQTLGITSKVTQCHEEGKRPLPLNDGSGQLGDFDCQSTYRLLVSSSGLYKLSLLGFKTERLTYKPRLPQRCAEQFIKIEGVVDEGKVSDTYCFKEMKRGMGMFAGLLTGQCSEVMLHSSEDLTYTCVLSSMNVRYWDEWKDTDAVYVATIFLDCVAEHFIQQGSKISGLERAVEFTKKGRALGLGVLGYHTYLQEHMMPFEGFETMMFNNQVFKHIHDKSLEASQWMAKEWGEPEWCKGYGVRNTHRSAVAPTMSTSLLVGGISQGIEPIAMNVFSQVTAAGTVRRINPTLWEIMKSRGTDTKEVLKDIEDNAGSVQHVRWLSGEEKEVFKTAFEINQKSILQQASQRQKWICQSQSLNLFFSANEQEEWISEVVQDFFEDPYLITLYYQRSQAGVQASKGECVACEA